MGKQFSAAAGKQLKVCVVVYCAGFILPAKYLSCVASYLQSSQMRRENGLGMNMVTSIVRFAKHFCL